jgi:G3E family GTPase
MGDDVQAIKAGILEAADVLVVNKADLPGADNAVRALQSSLELLACRVRIITVGSKPWTPAEPAMGAPGPEDRCCAGEWIHEVVDAPNHCGFPRPLAGGLPTNA